MEKGEIILYQPNETIKLEVRLEEESVWLTQAQIAALFGIVVPAIPKHIRNIYQSEELERKATVSKMEIVRQEEIEMTLIQNLIFQNGTSSWGGTRRRPMLSLNKVWPCNWN